VKIVALTDAFQLSRGSLPPAISNPANLKGKAFEAMHHCGEHFSPSTVARGLLIVGLCLFVTGVVNAQTPDPSPLDVPQPGVRPPLSPFPRFQDWSFLSDASLRVDRYDSLKFIPLNGSETNYLTFGLENRTEFQYLDNNAWGAGPQDLTGYVFERLMPSADPITRSFQTVL
jgi:hypothetical protein